MRNMIQRFSKAWAAFAVGAFIGTTGISNAEQPSAWKFWPFRSTPKPVAASPSPSRQEPPPVVRPQQTPVQVAPASFHAPLTSSAPNNIEPFPLPPGAPSAYELY